MHIAEQLIPHAKELLRQLQSAGVTEITIDFDGSGDSGSVQSVSFNPTSKVMLSTKWAEKSSRYVDGKWIEEWKETTVDAEEGCTALCYELLESTGIDWYNNDGGFGELEITLDPIEITLNVNTRYTEYNTDSFELEEL